MALVESFARHFLFWVHRWQEEGLAPAAAAFGQRLTQPDAAPLHIDPLTFDLVQGPRREALAEGLLLGGAA